MILCSRQLARVPKKHLLSKVYVLCCCTWGRHRSDAVANLLLWNWQRVGGSFVHDVCAPIRLSLGCNAADKCGNTACPDLS